VSIEVMTPDAEQDGSVQYSRAAFLPWHDVVYMVAHLVGAKAAPEGSQPAGLSLDALWEVV